MPRDLRFSTTERGFRLIEFVDRYGHGCSLQKSSLATDDAIWLGIDDPAPEVMTAHAARLGVESEAVNGWVPYPIPDEVLVHTRMHLTREQVAELLPVLHHFVSTGELPEETP